MSEATFIAMLRGVNMAGNRKLDMARLRTLAEDLHFGHVRTVQRSGNLLFSTAARDCAKLECRLETALLQHLGLRTSAFVRTAAEWRAIVAANPFHDEADNNPHHLAVLFLKHIPHAAAITALRHAIPGPERFAVKDRSLYAYYPEGFAATKLTTALIDHLLATAVTGRSWSTVMKIALACETAL